MLRRLGKWKSSGLTQRGSRGAWRWQPFFFPRNFRKVFLKMGFGPGEKKKHHMCHMCFVPLKSLLFLPRSCFWGTRSNLSEALEAAYRKAWEKEKSDLVGSFWDMSEKNANKWLRFCSWNFLDAFQLACFFCRRSWVRSSSRCVIPNQQMCHREVYRLQRPPLWLCPLCGLDGGWSPRAVNKT